MTSPIEQDSKVLDSEINLDEDDWYDPSNVDTSKYFDYLFNETGIYRHYEVQYTEYFCNRDYEFFGDPNNNLDKEDIFYDYQEVVCEDY